MLQTAAPQLTNGRPAEPEPREAANPHLLVHGVAASTKRRHFLRALRRVATLLVVDTVLLVAAHGLLEGVRASGLLESGLTRLFPQGFMGGWGSVGAVILGLVLARAYGSEEQWASPSLVAKGVALGTAIAMWQSIDTRGAIWTGLRWAIVAAVLAVILSAARRLVLAGVLHRPVGGHAVDRVILVGDPQTDAGRRAVETVLRRPGMQSVGWLSERADVGDYLGHPSAVWEVLCDTGTDTVVLCSQLPPELFDAVVEASAVAGCRVLSVMNTSTLMASSPRALNGTGVRILEFTFPAAQAGQDALKRAFDIVGSALLLALLSPLLCLIGVLIKLDSPGPIFFVQERVGQAGQAFRMIKFRTMRTGADAEKGDLQHLNRSGDPRLFKIPNDPRVTRLGRALRRCSLDELPQLFNVLNGQMSLVGPRPFFEADLAAYDDHHFIRLAVKPGITGLWQVKGRSSIVDFEEVVTLDREYVENWSIGLDLIILLNTLPAVLRRTGAY